MTSLGLEPSRVKDRIASLGAEGRVAARAANSGRCPRPRVPPPWPRRATPHRPSDRGGSVPNMQDTPLSQHLPAAPRCPLLGRFRYRRNDPSRESSLSRSYPSCGETNPNPACALAPDRRRGPRDSSRRKGRRNPTGRAKPSRLVEAPLMRSSRCRAAPLSEKEGGEARLPSLVASGVAAVQR